MDKIEKLHRKRQQAHQKLRSLNSTVYEAFLAMEKATYAVVVSTVVVTLRRMTPSSPARAGEASSIPRGAAAG
jgi:hypothetical protein